MRPFAKAARQDRQAALTFYAGKYYIFLVLLFRGKKKRKKVLLVFFFSFSVLSSLREVKSVPTVGVQHNVLSS